MPEMAPSSWVRTFNFKNYSALFAFVSLVAETVLVFPSLPTTASIVGDVPSFFIL